MLRVFISLILTSLCIGNTEIVNFDAYSANDADVLVSNAWSSFNLRTSEQHAEIIPAPLNTPLAAVCSSPEDLVSTVPSCPNEIWFKLNLDDDEWRTFSKFTFRVSWAASYPVDFAISILDPEAVAARFPTNSSQKDSPSTTRTKYARVRSVDIGVAARSNGHHGAPKVPFIVSVEPLHFGFVPESVIPLLQAFVPLLIGLLWAVPKVLRYVGSVADEARKEVYDARRKKK
ncbi:hypothetical protein WG66_009451 [Moniliophthora roreri]|uniref:Uncharacterized protein n=1 Tax=Moniliophthora roreri TaxID=221103 RepID=A0A0W0FA05_MONRR|nr:hypothetical protein WG66_009451 [Moniliophthora roreri]